MTLKAPEASISSVVFRDPVPPLPESLEISEELAEIWQATAHLSGEQRKRAIKRLLIKKRNSKLAELTTLKAELKRQRASLDRLKESYEELIPWSDHLILERPGASQFREFRKAVARGGALEISIHEGCVEFPSTDYEKEYLRHAEVFVVEHNWAAAFERAPDVDGAPFRLPYEVCAFEFQISGRRVIALAAEIDERVTFTPAIWTSRGWLIPGFVYWLDGALWISTQQQLGVEHIDRVADLIGKQIRAVCIALDAEIASTRVERAPHDRQYDRSHTTTAKGYHVVSLVRRSRTPPLEATGETGRRRRLHFRRGHWRHYDNHKTWIKWMLVGDPDLGFIDKHYTL